MDTLCGVGLPEIIIVALLGFVVIGPTRTRELAVQLGRMMSKVMRSSWFSEFQQVTNALRNLPRTLVRMAELEEAQADIKRTISDIERDTQVSTKQGGDDRGVSDPWGIRNAAAETTFTPETNATTRPETSTTSDSADTGEDS